MRGESMVSSVSTEKAPILTALFRDARRAGLAYQAALDRGYEASNVNVLMSDATRERYLSARPDSALAGKANEPVPETSTRAEVLGGPVGGTLGTLAPAIAAIGTALLLPGLGLAVAGPIAAALTAAGAAGVAAGLIGAFTNWGIPAARAEQYERGIRDGGIVIGVEPISPADREELIAQWKRAGGELIED
jgi:hypothetical protein